MKNLFLLLIPYLTVLACASAQSAPPEVTGLLLYNADTNEFIQRLDSGAVIDLSEIGTTNLSIVAETTTGTVSVTFGLGDDDNFRTESVAPFAIAGDTDAGTDLHAWTPDVGPHVLTATPFSQAGGGGAAGDPVRLEFSVVRDGRDQDAVRSSAEATPAVVTEAQTVRRLRLPLHQRADAGVAGSALLSDYGTISVLVVMFHRTAKRDLAARVHFGDCTALGSTAWPLEPIGGSSGLSVTVLEKPYSEIATGKFSVVVYASDTTAGNVAACSTITAGGL